MGSGVGVRGGMNESCLGSREELNRGLFDGWMDGWVGGVGCSMIEVVHVVYVALNLVRCCSCSVPARCGHGGLMGIEDSLTVGFKVSGWLLNM